jgi:hypothetical protein
MKLYVVFLVGIRYTSKAPPLGIEYIQSHNTLMFVALSNIDEGTKENILFFSVNHMLLL